MDNWNLFSSSHLWLHSDVRGSSLFAELTCGYTV